MDLTNCSFFVFFVLFYYRCAWLCVCA